MATDPRYPGASSRNLRGKITWRIRLPITREQITLKGQPGSEEFEAAYYEATRKKNVGEILNMPGRALPRSFGAAARKLDKAGFWIDHSEGTKTYNLRFIERFLEMQVVSDAPLKWRDVPVEAMTHNHLSDIVMSVYILKPQSGRHFLNAIGKLLKIAIDQKWIEADKNPALAIKLKKPKSKPNPKWPQNIMDKYEARHPIGTAAHTAYSLAKWLGNRRSDVSPLTWDQLVQIETENDFGDIELINVFDFRQKKNQKKNGGKEMILPVPDKLMAVLNALGHQPGKTILQRADGEPFSVSGLTGMMAHWTKQAGIPAGYTMHGLRRSFAHNLAKAKTPVTVIRDMMGHDNISTTQIYLDEIDRNESALEAVTNVNAREAKRDQAKRRDSFRIVGSN